MIIGKNSVIQVDSAGGGDWTVLSAALDPSSLANGEWEGETETIVAAAGGLSKYNLCYRLALI